ncbi:FUSC family protein [Micromonospora sp. WMMD1076]|uniref:FUSC family protein n=1 Tax=Micromonospora sp. WMMD1076 TaxID=3016103 RepID=UPI00249B67FC|nr:FUSC family protein [Micromonospora sp. WMMD1076]WFF04626.1 FUSC family protein [Micromonospora sp. WMMD1076]
MYCIVAVQAGLAAAAAWAVARKVGVSTNPVFAPIAAVSTVAAAVGQRLRRTVELILGVALGIGVADVLIQLTGRGTRQTGGIVTAAILLAIALSGRGGLITQAGGTAVLVSTVTPAGTRVEGPQIVNAVIGGITALAVVILLLPLNPLRTVERAAGPALATLSQELTATGNALRRRDADAVQSALLRLRAIDGQLQQLSEALQGAGEVVQYSPQRRRLRNTLRQYVDGTEYLVRAIQTSRGLARRAQTAIDDHERNLDVLGGAVVTLGTAVSRLHTDFVAGRRPTIARRTALIAVSKAGQAGRDGLGLSGAVVMAHVATIAGDLLRATTVPRTDANRLVRRAVRHEPGQDN